MFWFSKFIGGNSGLMNAAGSEGSEGGGGTTGDEGTKPTEGEQGTKPTEGEDPTEGKAPAEGEQGTKPTDREAELLKETMKRKERIKELEEQIKAFGDVKPEQIKALLEAENARKAEEADREKKELEQRGEWERLKEMMATEHQTTLTSKEQEIAELLEANGRLKKSIEDMTVGSSFSNSKFIGDELLLTPSKARVVYGQHFDVVDDKVVGYDKPVGAKDRTMLVDGNGKALSFDDALRKLIDADPERDSLIRAKAKPGAGSAKPEAGALEKPVSAGVGRIAAGLASFKFDSD